MLSTLEETKKWRLGYPEVPERGGDQVVQDARHQGERLERRLELCSGRLERGEQRELGNVPAVVQEDLLGAVWLFFSFRQRQPVGLHSFLDEGGELCQRAVSDLVHDQGFELVEEHCGRQRRLLVEGPDGCLGEEHFEACEVGGAEAAGDRAAV